MRLRMKHLLFAVLIIISISGVLHANEIMTLEEVKPGMTGIGKTVFRGFQVENFPIEVIDILENQGLDSHLILIKVGGEKIDEIGGIAAGMSGSPIYIDGKLIGAIGYGWQFSDHHYALVTPIESMLKLLKENWTAEKESSQGLIKFTTPLYISGLTGRAFNRIADKFKSYGFDALPSGGIKESAGAPAKIEPGSAIAVQLVRGDINISSIGTLTYIDGDDILAFGHPFMNKGQSNYFLSRAYINGVIPSIQQPFKLGSPAEKLLGSIKVDSTTGIAGKLNQFPRIVPLSVNVSDQDREKEETVNVQIIQDEKLLTLLAINVALQAIDSTLDRIGKGTAWVKYTIMGNGLPGLSVESTNMYYSRSDIAALALADFYQLLDVITTNPFKKVDLIKLQLDVEVENIDKVALVQEAKVLNKVIKPGDTLVLEVTLHPYRQEPFTRKISFELPEDIQPGMASITINGGFTGQSYHLPSKEAEEADQELNQAIVEGYKDFQSILDDYLKQPRNNELVIQVYPGYPVAKVGSEIDTEDSEEKDTGSDTGGDTEKESAGKEESKKEEEKQAQGVENEKDKQKEKEGQEKNEEEPEIKKTVATDYVLEGSLTLDINIEGPEGKSSKQEEKAI